jgi:type VI secretion system protein
MNSPVPLDVVFVMDQVLLDKLNSLPAAKWFDGRDEWVRTYPEQIQYRSYELVPGQNMNVTAEQFGVKHALAVLIYANYLDSGDHRARVDQYHKGMLVQLGPNELSVEARKDR